LTCNFNASGSSDDGSIVSYAWNFGDGSTGSGVTAAKTYASSGPNATVVVSKP
jgi:PKD repeat protein